MNLMKGVMAQLSHYYGSFMEGLKETMKNLSQGK
jgi:hypothetical protein